MSELKTSTEDIVVHLARPGLGVQDFQLSAGATLADLLRLSQTSAANQSILVDGVPLEETLPLHEGVVVTITPRPSSPVGNEPWRAAIPAFRDEALFEEYSDALISGRREISPDEEGRDE